MHRPVVFLLIAIATSGVLAAEEGKSRFAVGGSDAQYVHRIHLYDADKQPIDPTAPNAKPYSPMATCGKCHAYDEVAHGYHFNALNPDYPAGRAGEPWIYYDPRTGTQIPLSYRNQPGTYNPAEIGMTSWDFTIRFGRHMPGGGPGEPPEVKEEESSTARWNVAGKLAIDCMACHAGDRAWSQEAWADQIAGQNLAWASTVAYGLGSVADRVSRLPKDFDPKKPAEGENGPKLPAVKYDANRFDAEGKFFFDVVRRPSNNQCLQCHTTRHATGEKWLHEQDVHLAAGMSCVDCHRNGMDHHTVRGYVGEKHPTGHSVASFSCVGCHINGVDGQGGRLGSPKPKHAGIPPIHFEKMSCTSCHSGPHPGETPIRVQTSLAHALGLPEQRSFTEPPEIVEPVFIKVDGKVTPHRMMWPAFWGVKKGDAITPLNPDQVYSDLRRVLRIRKDFREEIVGANSGEEFRKKVGEALAAINQRHASGGDATAVYVARKGTYEVAAKGGVVFSRTSSESEPIAWPIAHNVRPARQSLGVKGCLECHATDAPIFYGDVVAVGPAENNPSTIDMRHFMSADKKLISSWEKLFAGRYMLKVMGMSVLAIVLLITLAHLGSGLVGLSRKLGGHREREDL